MELLLGCGYGRFFLELLKTWRRELVVLGSRWGWEQCREPACE